MRPLALCCALLAAGVASAGAPGPASDHPLDGIVVETATGAVLTPEALAVRLGAADVAILGEVHDNPWQHDRQAWLIEALDPVGVAFEMVPEAKEDALAGLDPAAMEEMLDWDSSGWPDWALYAPVFEAAAGRRITGGGVARAELMAAMEKGAASAWGKAPDAGLGDALDAAQQAEIEAEMIEAHCDALPPEMAPGLIEAQRLRDARFAQAALRAGEAGLAVLITGNGHARTDRGVPAYLARLAPEARVLSLGQVELAPDETDPAVARGEPFDFVWFSATAERDDPCAVFEDRGGSDG